VVDVGEEQEREIEFPLELDVRIHRIGRYAEHDGPSLLDGIPAVAEFTGLDRAAGRVVLGIEVEDDGAAGERLERDGAPIIGRKGEVRCFGSFGEHRFGPRKPGSGRRLR
jgi:hypothetical protein